MSQALSSTPESRDEHLEPLNSCQREAVEATDGAVLVLAGAGTGKTRVLTTRLAHIMMQGKARPWEILAVTFTNKAAREMKERVARLLGAEVDDWWLGTFHAMGARLLRTHAEAAGLKPNFTILDADDQTRLVKQLMGVRGLDEKRWPARTVLAIIQRWKDRGLEPGAVTDGEDAADGRALALYADYQERLSALNAADFGDLLLHCLTLFRTHPDILERYQRKFRYILVDEYQDSNVAQYLWLRLLAQGSGNICCVGDDDQSIYSWRGAEVGNILRFEKDFPGAKLIRLERNYRSTPEILAAASALIANNQGRLGKTLWTEAGSGDKVQILGLWDGEEEARATVGEIQNLATKSEPLDGMAVLVRAGFQTREFEERLIKLAIPYRVIGGPRFYERMEIRDAIAYLRVIAQPDDDLAFERIVNVPRRGLGTVTLRTLHDLARGLGVPLTGAVTRLLETDDLSPRARTTLTALRADFGRWRDLAGAIPHVELAEIVLDESGYSAMWMNHKSPDAPGRLENLKEMILAMEDFADLREFLDHVSLVMENEDQGIDDKVNLMTLHGAKGLEFDTVFLPGWEEGLFPHPLALDESGNRGLEEERRLAYVGLTRARKRAIVSFAANRRIYGRWLSAIPSRFIDELPPEHTVRTSVTGQYGHGLAERGTRFVSRTNDGDSGMDADADAPGLAIGQRIFHQKFGYGVITATDGPKLDIRFDKAGRKKVMARFVEGTP